MKDEVKFYEYYQVSNEIIRIGKKSSFSLIIAKKYNSQILNSR